MKHETKKHVLLRFFLVFLTFAAYFLFVCFRYGLSKGYLIAFLSWSFFVLCTPIADAGFLIDFPLRLILKFRMLHSEIGVWVVAISLNIFSLTFIPDIYTHTFLLNLFKEILTNVFPYWGIIILAAIGTFFSVYFGDELIDVAKHSERKNFKKHGIKHKVAITLFIVAFTLTIYYYMINRLGITS